MAEESSIDDEENGCPRVILAVYKNALFMGVFVE